MKSWLILTSVFEAQPFRAFFDSWDFLGILVWVSLKVGG